MSRSIRRSAVPLAMALSYILVASVTSAAADTATAPDGRGLIAWWKFDEPSGDRVADSSGNDLDGSLARAVRVPGVLQTALKLDKSSLRIPHSPRLKPKEQITISAWVKPDDLSGYQSVYRKEDGDERILLMFQRDGTDLAFGLKCSPYVAGGVYQEARAKIKPADFLDGQWHLITATYDGRAKRVYRDGRQMVAMPASGLIATGGTADAYVGSTGGAVEFFSGLIDDVRLYDRALGDDEIAALYKAGISDARRAAEKEIQRQYEQAHAARKAAEAQQQRRAALGKAALAEWDRANLQRFLEPLDLAAQARRTLHHYMTLNQHQFPCAPDCYCVHFLWRLVPQPTGPEPLGGWDFGDATSRAVINWPALREMTGDVDTGRRQEEGNRKFVLALLHPEKGLSMNLDAHDIFKPGGYGYMWDQSRTLRALVRWYQTRPADREMLRPRIQRYLKSLDAIATIRGEDPQWGPYSGFPSDNFVGREFKRDDPVGWINMRAGLMLEPVAEWAEISGDESALDLAIRFANCTMGGHEGDRVPASARAQFRFGPNGEIAGHLHTKTGVLIGLAKLSRHLAAHGQMDRAKGYLRQVKRSYDWLLAPDNPARSSRIGWITEVPGCANCETCCTADMIELAEAMAACATLDPEFRDWVCLHDDVESMTVNSIARAQLVFTPEFEKVLRAYWGDAAGEKLKTMRLLDGSWTAAYGPGDLSRRDVLDVIPGGCCVYSGMRGLHAGWRDAMTFDAGQLRINYFLKRQSAHAAMTTAQPQSGEAEIVLRADAKVLLRVPAWLKPSQMILSVDARQLLAADRLDATGHYASLGPLPAGTKIRVRFPLTEHLTNETLAGVRYTITWRGNYVVKMSPRGQFFPIYP